MAQQRRSTTTKKVEPKEWVYEHESVRISELDFTTAMMEKLDELTELTYAVSFPTATPKVMRCWLQVAFESRGDSEAEAHAAAMTFRECLQRFRQVPYAEDLPEFGDKDENGSVPT